MVFGGIGLSNIRRPELRNAHCEIAVMLNFRDCEYYGDLDEYCYYSHEFVDKLKFCKMIMEEKL